MSDFPSDRPSKPTSERKAASNRCNARKSTGPRTARGKSRSRLNAIKHGILASQAVIATTEGGEARKAFEELVDGLAEDFAPVGTFEQSLVQQIASCIWRQRRLLMFESRAAFQSRDDRTFREMNSPARGEPPLYIFEENHIEGTEVLEEAGLGLDLPAERDLMKLVRYESSITRSLRNAIAQLKAQQQGRRASSAAAAKIARAYKDRAPAVDRAASTRNGGSDARRLSAVTSRFAHRRLAERAEEEEAELRAEEAAEAGEAGEAPASDLENYQTKPNMPEDPEALMRHQRIMETVDSVLKLRESLAPKRESSGD